MSFNTNTNIPSANTPTKKPIIYVSSPFTKGDQLVNLKNHMMAFIDLIESNVATPIAPLAVAWTQLIRPQSYGAMIRWCLETVDFVDALCVVDSGGDGRFEYFESHESSKGVAMEVKRAKENGTPVLYGVPATIEWCQNEWQKHNSIYIHNRSNERVNAAAIKAREAFEHVKDLYKRLDALYAKNADSVRFSLKDGQPYKDED